MYIHIKLDIYHHIVISYDIKFLTNPEYVDVQMLHLCQTIMLTGTSNISPVTNNYTINRNIRRQTIFMDYPSIVDKY